jgi:hypothetical protein
VNKRVRGRKCTDARARTSFISGLIIVWIIFNEDINNVLSSPFVGRGGPFGTVIAKRGKSQIFLLELDVY